MKWWSIWSLTKQTLSIFNTTMTINTILWFCVGISAGMAIFNLILYIKRLKECIVSLEMARKHEERMLIKYTALYCEARQAYSEAVKCNKEAEDAMDARIEKVRNKFKEKWEKEDKENE